MATADKVKITSPWVGLMEALISFLALELEIDESQSPEHEDLPFTSQLIHTYQILLLGNRGVNNSLRVVTYSVTLNITITNQPCYRQTTVSQATTGSI